MDERTCTAPDCGDPSAQCGFCWKHYARMRKRGTLGLAVSFACIDCGGQFPRSGTRGPVPKRCRECARRRRLDLYDPEAVRRLAGNVECIVCGGTAPVGNRYCPANCRTNLAGAARPRERQCTRCGESFSLVARDEKGRLPPSYTLTCKTCHRGPRYYELTVADLAERDGFDCALCGEPVDLSLRSPHNLSPTVDHVIPWSRGGSHAAENLQLAHRICNTRKGVRME